jgi:hypothetical protein
MPSQAASRFFLRRHANPTTSNPPSASPAGASLPCPAVRHPQPLELLVHTLPEHVCPPEHVPHITIPPQPSSIVPQLSPLGHTVSGVQPHWFGAPPPPQV